MTANINYSLNINVYWRLRFNGNHSILDMLFLRHFGLLGSRIRILRPIQRRRKVAYPLPRGAVDSRQAVVEVRRARNPQLPMTVMEEESRGCLQWPRCAVSVSGSSVHFLNLPPPSAPPSIAVLPSIRNALRFVSSPFF